MDYTKFFITGKRPDGTIYEYLDLEAPEDLRDLVYTIHKDIFDGAFANDFAYSTIVEAFEALESDDIDNVSIEPDYYYSDLDKWFTDCPCAAWFCDESVRELGIKDNATMYDRIMQGQWYVKDQIYHAVDEWLRERRDEDSDEEEESCKDEEA